MNRLIVEISKVLYFHFHSLLIFWTNYVILHLISIWESLKVVTVVFLVVQAYLIHTVCSEYKYCTWQIKERKNIWDIRKSRPENCSFNQKKFTKFQKYYSSLNLYFIAFANFTMIIFIIKIRMGWVLARYNRSFYSNKNLERMRSLFQKTRRLFINENWKYEF